MFSERQYEPGGPLISSIRKPIRIERRTDNNEITLIFAPGNENSVQNAIGEIHVQYSNGTLSGIAGPVMPFDETFTPSDLNNKSGRLLADHIDTSLEPNIQIESISYSETKYDEHFDIAISPEPEFMRVYH